MTLQRFYYEKDTAQFPFDMAVFDSHGNLERGLECEVDGFFVHDRQRGHQNPLAFCLHRDDAKAIVEALNRHFGLQEAGL